MPHYLLSNSYFLLKCSLRIFFIPACRTPGSVCFFVVDDFAFVNSCFETIFKVPHYAGIIFTASQNSADINVSIGSQDHAARYVYPLAAINLLVPYIFCHLKNRNMDVVVVIWYTPQYILNSKTF